MCYIPKKTRKINNIDYFVYGPNYRLIEWFRKSELAKNFLHPHIDEDLLFVTMDIPRGEQASVHNGINAMENLWYAYPELGPFPFLKPLAQLEYNIKYHSAYRTHITHPLLVFLLGLYFFDTIKPLENALLEEIQKTSDDDPEKEFVRRWTAAALFHDIGYMLETIEGTKIDGEDWETLRKAINDCFAAPLSCLKPFENLKGREERIRGDLDLLRVDLIHMSQFLDFDHDPLNEISEYGIKSSLGYVDSKGITPIRQYFEYAKKTPPKGRDGKPFQDHGIVSALLLMFMRNKFEKYVEQANEESSKNNELKSYKKELNDLNDKIKSSKDTILHAAGAMSLHNINKNWWDASDPKNLTLQNYSIKLKSSENCLPMSFLLGLCDTLQDWDRPRRDFPQKKEDAKILSSQELDLYTKSSCIYLCFLQDVDKDKGLINPEKHPGSLFSNVKSNLKDYLDPGVVIDLIKSKRPFKESETEDRVLDAALPKNVQINKTTELIVMLRLINEPGLKKYLEYKTDFDAKPEDTISNDISLDFNIGNNGSPLPLDLIVEIETDDFEIISRPRLEIKLKKNINSKPYTFLIKPIRIGKLKIKVSVLQKTTIVGFGHISVNSLDCITSFQNYKLLVIILTTSSELLIDKDESKAEHKEYINKYIDNGINNNVSSENNQKENPKEASIPEEKGEPEEINDQEKDITENDEAEHHEENIKEEQEICGEFNTIPSSKYSDEVMSKKSIVIDGPPWNIGIEFENRTEELGKLIRNSHNDNLLISAPKGYGKTRLIEKSFEKLDEENWLCIKFDLPGIKYNSTESLFSDLLSSLEEQLILSKIEKELKDSEKIGHQINILLGNSKKIKAFVVFDSAHNIDKTILSHFFEELDFIREIISIKRNGIYQKVCFLFSGRYISYCLREGYDRFPLTEIKLTPFDFETVHQTVIHYDKLLPRQQSPEYIKKFASLVMIFTGGHPECMAGMIQHYYSRPLKLVEELKDEIYANIVKSIFFEVKKKFRRN